jgi:hypothetical protein
MSRLELPEGIPPPNISNPFTESGDVVQREIIACKFSLTNRLGVIIGYITKLHSFSMMGVTK